MSKAQEVIKVKANATQLLEAFTRSDKFVEKKEMVPVLHHVHLVGRGGKLFVEATDRYRLLTFEVEATGNVDDVNALINHQNLGLACSMLERATDKMISIEVRIYDNHKRELHFVNGADTFTCVFYDDDYPPVHRLFTGDYAASHEVVFNPKYLKDMATVPKGADTMLTLTIGGVKPTMFKRGERETSLLMPIRFGA